MSSGLWIMIGVIAVSAIVTDGVVKIIRAAKNRWWQGSQQDV